MTYDQQTSSLADRTTTTAPSSTDETTTPISIAPFHRDQQQQQSRNASREPVDQLISSANYTDRVHEIKIILNNLQKKLLQQPATEIMTSDSLKSSLSVQTTYSVSSNLISMIENTDIPCPILRNAGLNVNDNHQTTYGDGDSLSLSSSAKTLHRSRSRSRTIRYMSPLSMLILQLLLVVYVLHPLVYYFYFGIVSTVPGEQ